MASNCLHPLTVQARMNLWSGLPQCLPWFPWHAGKTRQVTWCGTSHTLLKACKTKMFPLFSGAGGNWGPLSPTAALMVVYAHAVLANSPFETPLCSPQRTAPSLLKLSHLSLIMAAWGWEALVLSPNKTFLKDSFMSVPFQELMPVSFLLTDKSQCGREAQGFSALGKNPGS